MKTYPRFDSHASVACFSCNAAIGRTEKPLDFGFPNGRYGVYCADCRMRTYYDTDDKSITFNREGNPEICSCGCTVPYEQWPIEYEGCYPHCPECGMV